MFRYFKISLFTASAIFLSACGGGGGSITSDATTIYSGQVIDSYVKNITYTCGSKTDITDVNGNFSCTSLPISFKVGNISLGTINSIPTDKQVFPQDLLGITRTNFTDSNLIKMAQFLQTIDNDDNVTNGIEINDNTISSITVDNYLNFDANEIGKTIVSETDAINHLQSSLNFIEDTTLLDLPTQVASIILSPYSTLDDATIQAIKYLADEERLAYDIYNKFYELYSSSKVFLNVPSKSEINHIKSVQALLKKYEITDHDLYDKSIDELTPSVYQDSEIQNLYDTLFAKGVSTQQDALEVGCMIEVSDVNDLTQDIQTAQNSNATDVVSIFEFLRQGSYNHYWGFDNALKNFGVSTGCCSLGEEYCKTEAEFPKTANQ